MLKYLALLLPLACAKPAPMVISPALIYDAWIYADKCAGMDSNGVMIDTTGHGLHGVVVRVVPKMPNGLLGQWQFGRNGAPDTITVVQRWADTAWVWQHELVHHRMHDTSYTAPDHPNYPFTYPCRLQVYQRLNPHQGIMAPRQK